MATAPPRSARRNFALSALIARRAVREARNARPRGTAAVAGVVVTHQLAQAQTSQRAVAEMLDEQRIDAVADAMLALPTYTTPTQTLDAMLEQIQTDLAFEQLVASVVQDAGRAAESVEVAVRNVHHVRYVNLPCCARCAILAGRIYRWSDGFERHPGCDCTMIPTTVASEFVQNPDELVRSGQVRNSRIDKTTGERIYSAGLTKADREAFDAGADLGQLVNVRKKAGLLEAGHAIRRGNRPTPAGIYRAAGNDRDRALSLLAQHGYIR